MLWLTPSPGSSKRTKLSEDPSWLQPAAGAGPGAMPTHEPPLQHRCEHMQENAPAWLQPAASCSSSSSSSPQRSAFPPGQESAASPSWLDPPPSSSQLSACRASAAQSATSHVRRVHLDLVPLLMIDSQAEMQSSYQQNGADPQRIRQVLSVGCSCGCMSKLPTKEVIDFCQRLHNLSLEARDHYIHTAYDTCGEEEASSVQRSKQLHTEWHLLGQRLNVKCLQAILGIGCRAFYKKCNGRPDMRKFPRPRAPGCPQSMIVDQFFCELYCSAAERLPEVAAPLHDVDAEISANQGSCDPCSEPLMFLDWTPHHMAMDVANIAVGKKALPERHLQHCRLSDLWWQFVAWHASCEEISGKFPCPHWSTFWRCWDARWRHALSFRKCSQHSQCNICFQYSAFLHKGTGTPEDKRVAAQEWRQHLTGQYHDRLIYWHMRWFSRLRARGVLCIIIDSMDKAKLSWPQYGFRKPKCLDRLGRPRLVITCAWAHGFCCDFYVGHDELQPHGASAFCEVMTRTIERVMDICKRDNLQPPEHLVIQSDNTTSQAKNSETGQYLATLVGRKQFLSALLNFLVVGHTHEDVDQLFSVLLALVVRRRRFHTPEELVTQIQIAMAGVFVQRTEEVSASLLGHVFDFGAWLDAEGIHLHNAFVSRAGVDAPHSFCYKLREDLTAEEAAAVTGRPGLPAPDMEDVFCITKRWMHSEQAAPPVLVLPRERLQLLQTPGPIDAKTKPVPMTQQRKRELEDLASHLEAMTEDWGMGFSYFRAATALRRLAAGDIPQPAAHTWLWGAYPARTGPLAVTRNRYFNTIPEMAWSLLIRFRRLQGG